MTTTVHDKNSKIITSDSRWSANIDSDHVLFVDDSHFEKMVELPEFALVMAGDAILIDSWKNWAKTDILNDRPDVIRVSDNGKEEYISVCLIVKPSTVLFDSQVATIVTPHARFSGSGREFARCCWDSNKSAITAIETASCSDLYTGGEVKYVELDSPNNNLKQDTVTIKDLHEIMESRGHVMNITTQKITTIEEYKDKFSDSKSFGNGSLVASAPTGDVNSPWNKEQEENLDASIGILRKLISKQ